MEEFARILAVVPEIIEAFLAILGALATLARYTPWKWDDKLFGAAEKPFQWAKEKKEQFKEKRAAKKPRKKRKKR